MALIHLDAGVLIGFLDSHDAHHDGSRGVIADALRDGDDLAMAASALAETLVGPARAGSGAVVRVHDLVAAVPITIVTLDLDIATRAAELRARHRRLRLPDALVIASAIHEGADRLVTTDRRWPTNESLGLGGAITHP